ncbi:MAG: cell division protein CrgA [Acidimicrobiales bacterium]
MGKPPKHRVSNSRVTEKGTRPQGEKVLTTRESYHPTGQKVSPIWVPVLMFALLGLGTLMIILNYVDLLPGGTSNWYLLAGLGLILGGIITATQLH